MHNMDDKKFTSLKNTQIANAILINKLNKLMEDGKLSINELHELREKTIDVMEQISFWGERGNLDRFQEELESYIGYIIKNYTHREKDS